MINNPNQDFKPNYCKRVINLGITIGLGLAVNAIIDYSCNKHSENYIRRYDNSQTEIANSVQSNQTTSNSSTDSRK
jgi:hypothetical protein